MQYKYEFEKGSRKYQCPQCHKKSFVRYIDNETGELIQSKYGRCDRENKCGYIASPEGEYNFKEVKYIPPSQTSYHPSDLVEKSGRNFKHNNLIQFLKTVFTEKQVKDLIKKYLIGTSKHWPGATVFWQIDEFERLRHGKIMLYNESTGKRAKTKNGRAYISSVRASLKLKDFNLKQCLFGLHLINEVDSSAVAIVESEKTAIIMSVFKPEYLWLATGSKSGFKYEYLKPLRNRKIIAFPDKSEYSHWLNKAIELNKIGFLITVSKYLEKTEYSPGTDLADIYFKELKIPSTPNFKKVIQTRTEITVKKWAEKKPEIWNLIENFKLEDHNGDKINRY